MNKNYYKSLDLPTPSYRKPNASRGTGSTTLRPSNTYMGRRITCEMRFHDIYLRIASMSPLRTESPRACAELLLLLNSSHSVNITTASASVHAS